MVRRSRLLGGNEGLGAMTRSLLVAGLVVASACGGKDKPPASTGTNTSALRIISQPVRNAQVGERMKYKAVLSKGGDAAWSMAMGPPGATVDEGGNVVWMPTATQGGPQSFTVKATMGGTTAEQTFVVSSAVTVMQAHGDVDPSDPNGATVSVDAPLSPAHGAAVQMEPGALPPGAPVAMTISSVDHAPVPAMAAMSGVMAGDLRPVDFGPTGLAFKKPVRIQLPMSAAVLAKGHPVIQTYDYETGTWHKLKPLSVDTAHGIVVAETQHFSTYVVVPDVKAMELSVGLGGANSACSDRLVVRAPLALAFADIPAAAVNGYTGGGASVADILAALPDGQALQVLIRVGARPLSGDGAQEGWVLGAASRQPTGKFKVTVTSDSHDGNFLTIPAEVAATELESWLNGSRVDFVFAALGAVAGGAAAHADVSMYVVAGADADRPPPAVANVFASEEFTELAPAAGGGSDDDCDGAPNQWDANPTGAAPPVVAGLPPGPIHVPVGGTVTLKVANPQAGTTFTWGAADPSVMVTPDGGGLSATIRPSAPGQFPVWVSGEAAGVAARFGWEIIADPVAVQNANTPPFVVIASSASLVRAGEPVLLRALTKDAEQATVTTTWTVSDPTTLVASAGASATFLANVPGDYLVTCVANDGFASSLPARVTITVLSATANRPPSVPSVSPMSPALQHAAGSEAKVDLVALARDPDGDAVTYEYAPDPQTPPTFTLVQAGPNATFATTQNGTYLFYVTATDSHGARGPWSPIKIQVLSTLTATTATDADKDGYPAGFDCNDVDPKIFPGAKELCGDGVDQNCDGRDQPSTECDADGDRFSPAAGDCDDKNPARSPAALERCDGIDNNCNAQVDEGFMVDVACTTGVGVCQAAGKTVCNAAWSGVVCGANVAVAASAEICDGQDNDCNGRVDDVVGQGSDTAVASDLANCGGCGIVCPVRSNSVAACVGGGCASACAAGYRDTDGNRDNGCECRLTNGGVEACDGLDNDCNGVVDDGGGVTYYDGPAGTAGNGVCRVGTKICKAGQLVIAQPARGPGGESCDGLDNDCNGKVDDGFDVLSDPRNCGGCGLACPAGVACLLGKCATAGTGDPTGADGGVRSDAGSTTMPPADGGFVGGDGGVIKSDGGTSGGMGLTVCPGATGPVCADLMNDNGNCGTCGHACAATDRCFAGVCQSGASTCPAPKAWCSDIADPAKMYCTDPTSDPRNCGGCMKVCPSGVPCQMGVCQGTMPVTACPATAPFGCPTPDGAMICSDLKYDPSNCGGCGKACPAGVACQGGVCGTQTCPAAAPTQCPTPTGDVCANLASDPKNCGRCGLVCPAGAACLMGVCGGSGGTMCPATAPSICPGPQGPLCTNLSSDPMNCGNCGVICPAGGACLDGKCNGTTGGGAVDGGTGAGGSTGAGTMCPATAPNVCPAPDGTVRCTDLMRDPGNCAMCGRVCPAGTQCLAGVCSMGTTSCPAPLMACANGCLDVMNDPGNCGRCGFTCAAGSGCQNGVCGGALTCAAPLVMCRDAVVGKTYCTDPNRDPGNCGGCGKTCPANSICTAGVCQGGGGTIQGLAACPGPNGGAMCVNLLGDPANCGACGRLCAAPMGCYGGICGDAPATQMCPPELKTCPDPSGKSYCANVLGDPGNCGACGRICPAGAVCTNGVCGGGGTAFDGGTTMIADGGTPTTSCPPNLYVCRTPDGQVTCVDLVSDSKNCGVCGMVCPATMTCQQKVCR